MTSIRPAFDQADDQPIRYAQDRIRIAHEHESSTVFIGSDSARIAGDRRRIPDRESPVRDPTDAELLVDIPGSRTCGSVKQDLPGGDAPRFARELQSPELDRREDLCRNRLDGEVTPDRIGEQPGSNADALVPRRALEPLYPRPERAVEACRGLR